MQETEKPKKNKKGYIYELLDPDTFEVRYVGQTRETPMKRFHKHKFQWKRSKGKLSYVNAWIKSLYLKDKFPLIKTIKEDIEIENLNQEEINHIKYCKNLNYKLTNLTDGGTVVPLKNKINVNKRLKTLKSSKLWKERNKRHSKILKNIHLEGKIKIGFKYLSVEKKRELREKAIEAIKKKICLLDENNNIIKIFNSAREAAIECNIKDSTHIIRVCKGKSKSGKTYGMKFKYYEK